MENKENNKKVCEICSGKGRVNGRFETISVNASWVPTHSEEETVWIDEVCKDCNGRGFLELKWV